MGQTEEEPTNEGKERCAQDVCTVNGARAFGAAMHKRASARGPLRAPVASPKPTGWPLDHQAGRVPAPRHPMTKDACLPPWNPRLYPRGQPCAVWMLASVSPLDHDHGRLRSPLAPIDEERACPLLSQPLTGKLPLPVCVSIGIHFSPCRGKTLGCASVLRVRFGRNSLRLAVYRTFQLRRFSASLCGGTSHTTPTRETRRRSRLIHPMGQIIAEGDRRAGEHNIDQ